MDWISDSYDNVAGYESSAYDTLMSIIARASDGTARMGCLHDAEALLLEDYVLTPLYTNGTAWELQGKSHRSLPGCQRVVQLFRCYPQDGIAAR